MYYNSGSPSLLAEKMDTYMFYLFKMSRVRIVITTKSSKDEKREKKKEGCLVAKCQKSKRQRILGNFASLPTNSDQFSCL